jgi:ElaB/YqjD/DUF883 family membrane-anchored ribosome-binding protein
MRKHKDEQETLADEARAFLDATVEVGGEKVAQARQRLAAVLEKAKEACDRVREKSIEGARAADESIREHPYTALGMAFGVGALVGCLLARRNGE